VPAGIYEVVTEGRFRYVEDGKTLVGSYIDVQLYYVTDVPTAFMAGSRINAVFGIAASAIEGNAGITRVSIEWLPKLYRETPAGRVFYGNQYVTTRSLARVARAAGWLSLGIGITMDAFNPDVTWEKTGLNAGIGVVGLVGGELAAVGAGAYFAVEAFYPDGWEGFSTDFGNLHY
jgi:hypothetical protein